MTRVAAVDCGTNSIRLLVADVDGDSLVDVDRRMEVVRLGEGVDRTGRLSAAALARTLAACDRFAEVIRDFPEVVEFYRMAGDVDYMLRVVVPDIQGYDTFYKKLIASVPLTNVTSRFAMEKIKSTTSLPIP